MTARITPSFMPGTQRSQRGASLIMVMMILIIVSILGVGGVQISLMGERSSRNDRDIQIATQAAEAGLMDAEMDIYSKVPSADSRQAARFTTPVNLANFEVGCGSTLQNIGLCSQVTSGQPAWLAVDFTDTSTSAKTAKFGQYTNRQFQFGTKGLQPVQEPRYVIEPVVDVATSMDASKPPNYAYRVTVMGFGPRVDTQVVMQMIYRN